MFFRAIPLVFAAVAAVNAAVYDVTVGGPNGTLTFTPEALSANVGDQVVFHFHPKNHTVTQSSFANPCGQEPGGFNSGFMPVAANQTDNFPTYTITVNDTKPIWVFCDQAADTPNSHCGAGMVFSVNCPSDGSPNSFTNFKKSALAIGQQLKASASAASAAPAYTTAAPAYTTAAPAYTDTSVQWTTAAEGGYTYAAAPSVSTVTVTVTVQESTWTTTYGSYPGSADPTPVSLEGQTHEVDVGLNGTLEYSPSFVMAQPRDKIVFKFHPKNHTATQSAFASPCKPIINADGTPALDSGFMPVAANSTDIPTWTITVNDTNPLWFFCGQTGHCGKGMVFAVNPVQSSARNFSAFQTLAQVVNGTNSTGAASTNTPTNSSSSNPASGSSTVNGADRFGINAALGLGSVLAAVAFVL
ncbi:hypothetical protein BDY19DRAFT_913727 [Irpex rosettiformis]|uniref:Uncharacterized protein n=1 Tax=Irpex rosettiformis TaxID=378272 RepID=A0ACB8UJR7_9APHY|nr:hypothetical protein BDY19DRAFT_913727 [Irpex rosettiformis]